MILPKPPPSEDLVQLEMKALNLHHDGEQTCKNKHASTEA